MKTKEIKIENKIVIQIYLSKEEKANTEIQKEIQQIKEKNKNVVIFISGDEKPNKILENMVNIMKREIDRAF